MGKYVGKCSVCGTKEGEIIVLNNKKYCQEHYEEYMNIKIACPICNKSVVRKKATPLLSLIENKKNTWFCSEKCKEKHLTEMEYKDKLTHSLVDYFGYTSTTEISTAIYVQMNIFKKKYNMTYQGMYLTYNYCVSNNIKIEKGSIIVLQWNYEKAKEDYIKNLQIQKSVEKASSQKSKIIYYKYIPQKENKQRIKKILYLPED